MIEVLLNETKLPRINITGHDMKDIVVTVKTPLKEYETSYCIENGWVKTEVTFDEIGEWTVIFNMIDTLNNPYIKTIAIMCKEV